MVAIRLGNSLNALRATRTRVLQGQRRTFVSASRLQASGYGDGKGDPKGEHPEKQPGHSQAQESSEHPGPAAPDVGKGTANASTKGALSESMKKAAGSEKSPEEASAQSGGSRSKEAVETGSSPTGGKIEGKPGGEGLKGPQGAGAPQPKIHNQSVPGVKPGLTDEQKQEVERHNKDFEKKHDMADSAPQDKVNKKFWKGT